jgi:hypothetical protein
VISQLDECENWTPFSGHNPKPAPAAPQPPHPIDVEPEFAYLDLITCGEILANFYDYGPNEIYDNEAKAIFTRAFRPR